VGGPGAGRPSGGAGVAGAPGGPGCGTKETTAGARGFLPVHVLLNRYGGKNIAGVFIRQLFRGCVSRPPSSFVFAARSGVCRDGSDFRLHARLSPSRTVSPARIIVSQSRRDMVWAELFSSRFLSMQLLNVSERAPPFCGLTPPAGPSPRPST